MAYIKFVKYRKAFAPGEEGSNTMNSKAIFTISYERIYDPSFNIAYSLHYDEDRKKVHVQDLSEEGSRDLEEVKGQMFVLSVFEVLKEHIGKYYTNLDQFDLYLYYGSGAVIEYDWITGYARDLPEPWKDIHLHFPFIEKKWKKYL